MAHTLTILVITSALILALAVGLDYARREVSKKRKDYRMRAALRRGLANPNGVRLARVVDWQACESPSANL